MDRTEESSERLARSQRAIGDHVFCLSFLSLIGDAIAMLTDNDISELQAAVDACEEAREELEAALQAAEKDGEATDEQLADVGEALEAWRDGQRHFMTTVREAEVDDVSTAAMLLKMNHGIDSTEARRGLPGVPVEGADQNFDMDLTGTRGSLLTTAAMEYVTD